MKKSFFIVIFLWIQVLLIAQIEVRPEDHFWRRRVAVRIELNEKMNLPFKYHLVSGPDDFRFTESNGMVIAILNAVKAGEITGYDAHSWKPLQGKDILKRMKYLSRAWNTGKYDLEGEKKGQEAWDNVFVPDDEPDALLGASLTESPSDGMFTTEVYHKKINHNRWEMDLTPYEQSVILVDDWIFDKNSSIMRYNTQYVQILWVDPTGTLPERVLANFEYKDLIPVLENVQWKAKWNDKSSLNLRQALDLHLYHGFPVNISGNAIQTMDESQKRYQELIEFESHLWSN